MCYRVNSDNSGRVTGVSYYGPDGSDNTIEAEIVILSPFIYDNTRLLLLSKTEKFPNGLANSSGQVGKHIMTHIGARVFAAFDDRYVNIFMGPSAQKHTLDDFNADNFDHKDLGFIRGAQISVGAGGLEGGPIGAGHEHEPAARHAALGRRLSRFLRQVLHAPRRHRGADRGPALRRTRPSISIPNVRDAWGLPAPRLTYDWRRPNELKRVEFIAEEAGGDRPRHGRDACLAAPRRQRRARRRTTRAAPAWAAIRRPRWSTSTARAGTFPTCSSSAARPSRRMSGFNPTLTIQALAYMTADAIVNRYRKSPGPLI